MAKVKPEPPWKWDRWQEAVLRHEGNVVVRSGRQAGKSTVIGRKSAEFVRDRPGSVVLVIAASQKQSGWLFDKIKAELEGMPEVDFETEPTRTKAVLTNGSVVHSLPAGRTGYFLRGLAIDLLIVDEAAYIAEEVWKAVIPMIAVSRKMRGLGWVFLLSTPFGKGGYFYNCCHDPDFKEFHVTSESCSRIPRDFLLKERKRMTKAEYAQEYLAQFIDEWNQYFPTAVIKERMTFIEWERERNYVKEASYYLGVDIARYGEDETAYIISEISPEKGRQVSAVKALTNQRLSLTNVVGRILALHKEYNFRRIFIDDAGVGGGVMDMLVEKIGKRAVGLNNAKRAIDKEGTQHRILKEDLYSNALVLMESKKINIVADPGLLRSLKSITYEYTGEGKLRIHGKNSHLAEAFVRACWCVRDKGLRVFLA